MPAVAAAPAAAALKPFLLISDHHGSISKQSMQSEFMCFINNVVAASQEQFEESTFSRKRPPASTPGVPTSKRARIIPACEASNSFGKLATTTPGVPPMTEVILENLPYLPDTSSWDHQRLVRHLFTPQQGFFNHGNGLSLDFSEHIITASCQKTLLQPELDDADDGAKGKESSCDAGQQQEVLLVKLTMALPHADDFYEQVSTLLQRGVIRKVHNMKWDITIT